MPGFFDLMPAPDWAATTTIATGNAAGHTPEEWARAIFDPRTVPPWVGALLAVRQTAVKALGIPRGLLHDAVTRSMMAAAARRLAT